MYEINVNGKNCRVEQDQTLLRFLRDELRLTGTKDGCSEGACGSCTVLVDGRRARACSLKVSRLAGKRIVTIEGVPAEEMRLYEHCFAAVGAVQCGFCIPGMVLAAKSLLDTELNPTPAQVAQAIKGNLCRCTGYQKIMQAIMMAAEYRRERKAVPEPSHSLHMDECAKRLDVAEKVNGSGLFADDLYFPGMLHVKAIFSPYPRALIRRVDVSKALAHPECAVAFTRADVPCNKIGHAIQDWDVMIGEGQITKYVGNVLAVVASENTHALAEIAALVTIDCQEMQPVTSPAEALADGAPLIHAQGNILSEARLVRGNADAAIAASRYVVTQRYLTPWQEHAFMEPECCVALPEGEDGLMIYSSCQSVYDVQRECATMLGIDAGRVHCRAPLIGGGFGGKEDMSVQPYAALVAWKTKRPAKYRYTRQESISYHVKRHPMELVFTTACDENGILTAMKGTIVADTGAYASLGTPVLHRACTHAAGPYNYQNIDIFGQAVYTNNVVAGAFRGFGVAQSCFATEMNINRLAEMCGLDPWEFRRRNAIKPGDRLPNGQIASEDTNLVACLEAIKDDYYANPRAGLACGFKNSGTGMGREDVGRVLLSVEDGRVHIRTSAACMGQGIGQMALTEICHVTDLDPAKFVFEAADTCRTPDSGTSTASRQTVLTGEAARRAGAALKAALEKGKGLESLEGRSFMGEYSPHTDPLGAEKDNPISHVSYSYGAQLVILDEQGLVERVISAFDVGTPVNVLSVEGQIEGGVVMGLGYSLSEKFTCVQGRPQGRLATLGLWRADKIPQLEVRLCRPVPGQELPVSLGAKGCGELCMIPTAPACAHAYYRWDGRLRLSLPLEGTPYNG